MPGKNLAAAFLSSSLVFSVFGIWQQTTQQEPTPSKAAGPAKRSTATEVAPRVLFAVKVKGQWGYMDERGRVVIAPQFEDAGPFSEDLAAVKTKGQWGFIDKMGALVIPAEYEEVQKFSEGFAAAKKKFDRESGWGFVDRSGKPITKFWFISASDFVDGLGWARNHRGRDGFVDPEGNHFSFDAYDWIYPLQDGLALVQVSEKCGFIDRIGTLQIAAELDCNPVQFTGIASGGTLGRMRLVRDLTGFSGGMAAFAGDKKWGYLDKSGKIVIEPQFTSKEVTPAVQPFSDGIAAVSIDDKWGYVDKTGKMVVPPVYENKQGPGRFSEGRAAVQVQGKWGYIDASGKLVVAAQFDKADPYAKGLARVWLEGKVCYVDKAGKLIWQPPE